MISGDQRVEAGVASPHHLGEGADELVPAAVRPTDGTQDRVARSLLADPVEPGHMVDDVDHVRTLERRVLDVRLAAALTEAPLVEAEHAETGVEQPLEGTGGAGAAAAPAVAVQHDRHGRVRRGGRWLEQGEADVDRTGLQRVGLRHAGDAPVACSELLGRRRRRRDQHRESHCGTGEQGQDPGAPRHTPVNAPTMPTSRATLSERRPVGRQEDANIPTDLVLTCKVH